MSGWKQPNLRVTTLPPDSVGVHGGLDVDGLKVGGADDLLLPRGEGGLLTDNAVDLWGLVMWLEVLAGSHIKPGVAGIK